MTVVKAQISYLKDIKYVSTELYQVQTPITPDSVIHTYYSDLFTRGYLVIRAGFPWDGNSGPVKDCKESMRASMVHDDFYDFFRKELLDPKIWRKPVDQLYRQMCIEDGMPKWKADMWYRWIRRLAWIGAKPGYKGEIQTAP